MKILEDTLARIEAEASKNRKEAYNQYIQRNAKAGVNDIVTDGRGVIRVTKVSLCLGIARGMPTIEYTGVCIVKENGEYRDHKRGMTGYASQDKSFKVIVKKGV